MTTFLVVVVLLVILRAFLRQMSARKKFGGVVAGVVVDNDGYCPMSAEECVALSNKLADHTDEGIALIGSFREVSDEGKLAKLFSQAEAIAEDIRMCRDELRDGRVVFENPNSVVQFRQGIADALDIAMRLSAAAERRVSPFDLEHRRGTLQVRYRIRYAREDGKVSIRKVQAVGHSAIADRAYLWAYCERSEKILTFRTDRIKALTDLDLDERVAPKDIPAWLERQAAD